jgi:hypothetical protein
MTSKIFLALLLVALVSCQTIDLSQIYTPQTQATLGPEYQDPNFLKILSNYFGCKTWQNGSCVECSGGYIFNKNGVCCLIDLNCKIFNRAVGVCENCYTGFYADANGTCTARAPTDPALSGCADWLDNVCQSCAAKHFKNAQGSCVPVNDQCREWNTTTGQCTSCYFGYALSNGTCVLDAGALAAQVVANPLCNNFTNTGCVSCADRAVFDSKGICKAVDTQCNTWDKADGLCLSCYQGYNLQNGSCLRAADAAVSDVGCKAFSNGACVECSARWVFNALKACIPVSDTCKTHDGNGNCLTCYPGYQLNNSNCQASPLPSPTDPGCKEWDYTNKVCKVCSDRWVKDANGLCVQVNTSCRSFDASGACTGCYLGYDLQNASCVFAPASPSPSVSDVGCHIWNWTGPSCQQCSEWWFLNASKVCVQVSDLCASYNGTSGWCLTCYNGYRLNDGVCVPLPTGQLPDPGCRNYSNGRCLECSQNWVINGNSVCVPVSDQCQTHNGTTGWCLTCYGGYSLADVLAANGSVINRICNVTYPNDVALTNPGCKTFENGACVACSKNWVAEANGICQPVSSFCRTHNLTNGWCLSCYQGYALTEAKNAAGNVVDVTCNLTVNDVAAGHPGCAAFENGACVKCSLNWFFNSAKTCVPVSDLCASHDANTGECLSCYQGYNLAKGVCSFSPDNLVDPLVAANPGCKTWQAGICAECSLRWVFNTQGDCVPVSDICRTHDANGLCLTCYSGYILLNGSCGVAPQDAPADVGCQDYDLANKICRTCSQRWVFNAATKLCVAVKDDCRTFDASGACTGCYFGYDLSNGSCVLGSSAPSGPNVQGCGIWNWTSMTCQQCSQWWYFNASKVCVQVSDLCASYNATSGACLTCFQGFSLTNGVCAVSTAPGVSDVGCRVFNGSACQ